MDTISPKRELPAVDTPVGLRLPCCDTDRPARVVRTTAAMVRVTQPYHPCRNAGPGDGVLLVWASPVDVRSVTGELRSVLSRPPRWDIAVVGEVEIMNRRREARHEFGVMAVIWRGTQMVPTRIVDRSASGFGCLVGGGAPLKVNDIVTVECEGEKRRAIVVRVRPADRSLDIGLKLLA